MEHPNEGKPTWFTGPYEQILLFGDSITQGSVRNRFLKDTHEKSNSGRLLEPVSAEAVKDDGKEYGFCFAGALQHLYSRQFDVIIRGFNGYNTEQAVTILPGFMPTPWQAKVRLMVVYFGTNDSNLEGLPGSQFVSLGGYKENLKKIVKHACVTQHQPHVLLVTPGPVNAEQFDDRAKGLRTEENTKKYVEACEEAGAELEGVEVVNLWQAIWSEAKSGHGELKTFFTDGVHLNGNGYRVLFKAVMDKIEGAWADMHLERTETPHVVEEMMSTDRNHWKYPAWSDEKSWKKILSE